MLFKLFFAIASLTVIAAALLGMHHHRLQAMHAMADLHVQMDRDRKATWDAQAKIAEGTHPVALRSAVERIGLELEPLPALDGPAEAELLWPSPDRFSHAPHPRESQP